MSSFKLKRKFLRELVSFKSEDFIPESFIRYCLKLYLNSEYDMIFCNYAHTVRILKIFDIFKNIPPSFCITHDANSLLAFDEANPSKNQNRLVSEEKNVLSSIKNMVVCAISQKELEYFRNIGVQNPLVLCEYSYQQDNLEIVDINNNFLRKRIIYFASNNYLNVEGILWFIENCWEKNNL